MHDIQYEYALGSIKGRVNFGSYGGPSGVDDKSPRFVPLQNASKQSLSPNESDTISIDFKLFKIAEPIERADIGIIVSFRLSFTFWQQERIYHFITIRASDGRLYWVKKPVDNK
jgi:hypothetical protein